MVHQQLVDALLGKGVQAAAFFAGIDQCGSFGDIAEQLGVGQIVVDHHLGVFEKVFSAQGNQAGITGTGTDKVDFTVGR